MLWLCVSAILNFRKYKKVRKRAENCTKYNQFKHLNISRILPWKIQTRLQNPQDQGAVFESA